MGVSSLDESIVSRYFEYLKNRKNASKNTLSSYKRDLDKYFDYLKSIDVCDVTVVDSTTVSDYISSITEHGNSSSTALRNLASVRSFYKFLEENRYIDSNPARDIEVVKYEKRPPQGLTKLQVALLLEMPVCNNIKGYRDKALLELMYATGMRVTDLINLKMSDINLNVGYMYRRQNGKESILPIYSIARESVRNYVEKRKSIPNSKDSDVLFLNLNGSPLTRQGVWKIVKYYQKKTGLKIDITPHSIRHSFAIHMLENGADLKSVQELMGHSDISSTQVYQQVIKNKLSDVYEKSHPRAKTKEK